MATHKVVMRPALQGSYKTGSTSFDTVYHNNLLIFDSRLMADKSTATQIVRFGDFLCLNPIVIYVVICSRAEVIE